MFWSCACVALTRGDWTSCGSHVCTLTLSLLALGRDRSWSEGCWVQLEPVGPDMLRPTTGYAPI